MKSICVFCGSSDLVHADYLARAHSIGESWLKGNPDSFIYDGEAVGIIRQSINTLSLAYDVLTRMDVPADMHARKARMYELADGILLCRAALALLMNYLKRSPGRKQVHTRNQWGC